MWGKTHGRARRTARSSVIRSRALPAVAAGRRGRTTAKPAGVLGTDGGPARLRPSRVRSWPAVSQRGRAPAERGPGGADPAGLRPRPSAAVARAPSTPPLPARPPGFAQSLRRRARLVSVSVLACQLTSACTSQGAAIGPRQAGTALGGRIGSWELAAPCR